MVLTRLERGMSSGYIKRMLHNERTRIVQGVGILFFFSIGATATVAATPQPHHQQLQDMENEAIRLQKSFSLLIDNQTRVVAIFFELLHNIEV